MVRFERVFNRERDTWQSREMKNNFRAFEDRCECGGVAYILFEKLHLARYTFAFTV